MRVGARRGRKAPIAISLWRSFAGPIEADLADRGFDIADWHQATRDRDGRLKLSSRKLLVLLEHSRDESAFAGHAVRGGRQSRTQRVREELINELMRLRASYEAVASRGEVRWDPSDFAWLDPVDEKARAERLAAEQAEAEASAENLYADMGMT